MILVIFDIDGTLLYSNRIDSLCFAATYERLYGRAFPTIDWRRFPHVTDTIIFDTVIREHFERPSVPEEVAAFQDHYVELLVTKRKDNPDDFREVPGARQLIERLLREEDYRVGIATGGWQRPAHIKLDHVGIRKDAMIIRGADNLVRREDIIQNVIDRARKYHQLEFKKIVYVGDAEWDVTTTRNMQIDFIGVRREGDHELLIDLGADHVLTHYLDQTNFMDLVSRATPPRSQFV